MGCCSVCGKKDSKALLFMPSNTFVFLCDIHTAERMQDDSNIPIKDWVNNQKKKLEDVQ